MGRRCKRGQTAGQTELEASPVLSPKKVTVPGVASECAICGEGLCRTCILHEHHTHYVLAEGVSVRIELLVLLPVAFRRRDYSLRFSRGLSVQEAEGSA